MNDLQIILCYLPLAIFAMWVIVHALRHDRRKRLTGNIIFVTAVTLGWLLAEITFFASSSYEASFFVYDLRLPFVGFLPVAILLFVLRFFSLDIYHTPFTILVFSAIPLVTTVLALMPDAHNFLRVNLRIISTSPHHQIENARGIWFWIHTVYCYLLTMSATIIVLVQHRKLPKRYRPCSMLLITGMCVSIFGNLMLVMGGLVIGLDYSLYGAGMSIILLYFATQRNQGLDFLNHARNDIFNELDEAILIVDTDDIVISRNLAAKRLLQTMGADPQELIYRLAQQQTFEHARQHILIEDEQSGIDYYLNTPKGESVYNVREKVITNRYGRPIGLLSICSDVSENRAAIRKLEMDAGLDAMTGLLNRRMIQEEMKRIDGPRHIPITVISCDLNGLKTVNDTMGHQQGDVMLRVTAETLTSCCPPSAYLARTGGDEFVILIPNYTQRQAVELIEIMRRSLADPRGHSLPISMAFGAATKTDIAQEIEEVVQLADERMYLDKQKYHAGRPMRGR